MLSLIESRLELLKPLVEEWPVGALLCSICEDEQLREERGLELFQFYKEDLVSSLELWIYTECIKAFVQETA